MKTMDVKVTIEVPDYIGEKTVKGAIDKALIRVFGDENVRHLEVKAL